MDDVKPEGKTSPPSYAHRSPLTAHRNSQTIHTIIHTMSESSYLQSLPPVARMSIDLLDYLLVFVFESIILDFTNSHTLWDLSPSEAESTLHVHLDGFFNLRNVCRKLNWRITEIARLWSVFPFGQMDELNVYRSLARSRGHPITVIVSDVRSYGLFGMILRRKKRISRIQTLYIDLPADFWPAMSPLLQIYRYPRLRDVFFSSRGVYVEDQVDGNGGNGGGLGNAGGNVGWGNAGGNGVGWGNAGGNVGGLGNVGGWGVGGQAGGAAGGGAAGGPTLVVARRRDTQRSYKVGIARLKHIPAKLLCIRDSAFGFQFFTPPPELQVLQIHPGYDADTPFLLSLADFHISLRPISVLQELELWNVKAFAPRDLQPVTGLNIRRIALRGPSNSIATLTHYLRRCDPTILVLEISSLLFVEEAILMTDVISAVDTFTSTNTIASIGIFASFPKQSAHQSTVELVIKSTQNNIMSLTVSLAHVRVIRGVLESASIPNGMRLSFDATPGEDDDHIVQTIFQRHIPLDRFRYYHLCIEDHQLHDVLSAVRHLRPPIIADFLCLHGKKRNLTFAEVVVRHKDWTPYIKVALESVCQRPSMRGELAWVASDTNRVSFSSSVPYPHDHLLRMFEYELL